MAQASAELSEAELDAVAGGKMSNNDVKIFASVGSLGIACAWFSMVDAMGARMSDIY